MRFDGVAGRTYHVNPAQAGWMEVFDPPGYPGGVLARIYVGDNALAVTGPEEEIARLVAYFEDVASLPTIAWEQQRMVARLAARA